MWVPSIAPTQAGNPHFLLYVFIMFSNLCSFGKDTNVDCKRFTTAAHTSFTHLHTNEHDMPNKFAMVYIHLLLQKVIYNRSNELLTDTNDQLSETTHLSKGHICRHVNMMCPAENGSHGCPFLPCQK